MRAPLALVLVLVLVAAAALAQDAPVPAAAPPAPCAEWVLTRQDVTTRQGSTLVGVVTDEPISAVRTTVAFGGDEAWTIVTRRCSRR